VGDILKIVSRKHIQKTKHILGFIASDHRGFELKEHLKEKFPLIDLGTFSCDKKVDEVDYAKRLVKLVLEEKSTGILICGSGFGMDIAANRHKGIRATLCHNLKDVEWARYHTDANVLVLSGEFTKPNDAEKLVKKFYDTKFSGIDRYKRRNKKMDM
jgi:ribose 5-phosphate isomerase B